MGTSQIRSLSPELANRFTIIQSIPQFGLYLLDENHTHKQCLLREMLVSHKNEFEQLLIILEERRKLPPFPYITHIKDLLTLTDSQYCLNKYKLLAIFEYPHHNLEEEIRERSLQRRKFSEKELWSVLASCILGLSFFEKNGITHECLRSSQILLGINGSIKVADPFCSAEGSNYQLLLEIRNTRNLYPSPEACQNLSQRLECPPSSLNFFRSDVFTLGMILLEAGLLQSQDDCYYSNKTCISWQKVQRNLHVFQEIYGPDMRAVAELLLTAEFQNRPDWVEMEQTIKKSSTTGPTAEVITVQTVQKHERPHLPQEQKVGAVPYQNQFNGKTGAINTPQHSKKPIGSQSDSIHSTPINRFEGAESNITAKNQQQLYYTFMNSVPESMRNSPSQSGVDSIAPIQPAPNIMTIRPKFNLEVRPRDNYQTKGTFDPIDEEDGSTQRQSKASFKKSATKFNVPYVEAFSHGSAYGLGIDSKEPFKIPPGTRVPSMGLGSSPIKNTNFDTGFPSTTAGISSSPSKFLPSSNTFGAGMGTGFGGIGNFQTSYTPTNFNIKPGISPGFDKGILANKFGAPEFKVPQFENPVNFGATSIGSSLGNVNTSLTTGVGDQIRNTTMTGFPTNRPDFSTNNFDLGNLGFKNYSPSKNFNPSPGLSTAGGLGGSQGLTDFSKLGIGNFKRPNFAATPSTDTLFKPGFTGLPSIDIKPPSMEYGGFQGLGPSSTLNRPSSQGLGLTKGAITSGGFNSGQSPSQQYLTPSNPKTTEFERLIKAPQSPVLDLLRPYEKQPSSTTNPNSGSGASSSGFTLKPQQLVYDQMTKPSPMNPTSQPPNSVYTDYSQFARISSPSVSNQESTFTTKVGSGSTITHSERPHFTASAASSQEILGQLGEIQQGRVRRGNQSTYFNKAPSQEILQQASYQSLKSNPPLTMSFQPNKQTRSSAEPLTHSDGRLTTEPDNANLLLGSSIQTMAQSANFGQAQKSQESIKPEITRPPIRPPSQENTIFVIETFKNGSRYEGEKLNGMKHGTGKFYYQDGGLYDGDWKANRMEGYGKLYYQTGKLAYKGYWSKDQFQGHGVLYNQTPQITEAILDCRMFSQIQRYWTEFQGQFVHDIKDGKGILYLSNGDYFQGTFTKDVINGPGVYYSHDGNTVKGTWLNNQLVKLES